MYIYTFILESSCPYDCVRVLFSIFWTTQPFATNLLRWCIILSWNAMQGIWFAFFKVKIIVGAHEIQIFLACELLILLQPDLVLMAHHHMPECLVEKTELLCSRSRSQQKFFLNKMLFVLGNVQKHWTFCYQTWFGDTSPWASVLRKKITLLFSRPRSQWELIGQDQGQSKGSNICWMFVIQTFLYHLSLCNPTWCVDVLLLDNQTERKQSGHINADKNTVIYST